MHSNNSQQVFFELLRAGLWGKEASLLLYGQIDFGHVMKLAEEQSVLGVVTSGLERVTDVKIPQEWTLQFIGGTLQLEQGNKEMNAFIARLVKRMGEAGIYTLLVKGQGIAQCYEKPDWRACGDVDLFLSDDNYEKAKAFLKPLASSLEEEYVREKHLGMTIDGWVVELHGRLYCGLSSRIERELDSVYQDSFCVGEVRSWNCEGVQVFLLKAENDVFYVFTHILQHFYKEGVGLRQICDWCRLLWTYRDSLNHGLLESRIRKAGLMSEWRAFAAYDVEYLGMPVDAMPMYSPERKWIRKAECINKFVLNVGNIGHNRGSWLMEHDSWLSRLFIVRKTFSMFRRIGDLISHARIFPLDSLRFSFFIMENGLVSAVRGEG